jgi:hypothetical protein
MTTRVATAALLALMLATLTLGLPRGAAGCSGPRMAEVEAAVDAPDIIFTGTVVKRDEPFSLGMGVVSSDDRIGWTFVVESVETGPQVNRVRVESPRMDASCGVEFSLGGRYRVRAHDEGGSLSTVQGDVTPLERLPDAVRPPTEAGAVTFGAWPAVIGLAAVLLAVAFVAWSGFGARTTEARRDS